MQLVAEGIAQRFSSGLAASRVARELAARHGRPLPPPYDDALEPDAVIPIAEAAWEPEPPVGLAGQTVSASEVRADSEMASSAAQYSMGFAVMFVLFVTVGGSAGILEERKIGTLRRLLVTPASKGTILAGKIVSLMGTALIEIAILVGFGSLVMHVPWGNDPVALLAVMVPYLLAATGLGVMVTGLARTPEQLGGLTPLVATGLSMLGGCYWQVEIMPPVMQTVAKLTPTGWAMAGLTDVVVRNQGLSAAATPALVLLGFAAVFFAVGLRALKFE